jgi:Uri superfamily endonuclease
MAIAEILLSNNRIVSFPRQSRGSYVLLMVLSGSRIITIGSLSDVRFSAGFYAYVGSAMGGIAARLGYHLKRDKKRHWHIDYLLEEATIVDVSICENDVRTECDIARSLSSQFDSVPGFGSSDCRCRSHLFFHADEGRMRDGIRTALSSLPVLLT